MQHDKLQKLLEAGSRVDREELGILATACEDNLATYKEKPTALHKRDLDAARAGMEEAVGRLWQKYFPAEETFDNLLGALGWLQGQGFKIKKSKLYNDRKKQLIRVQPDGSVRKRDVEAYSKGLQKIGDPLKGLEAAQQRKLELEGKRLEADTALKELELETKRGNYVLRSEADLEKSAHLSVVETSVRNMHAADAPAIIELVGGDLKRVPFLMEFLNRKLDETFNYLAGLEQFEVVFGEDDC